MKKNQKVVVTGGAGFIGSNLVRLLLDRGKSVAVVDDLSTGHLEFLEGLDIEFINQDVSDESLVSNAIFRDVERVYHLAADIDNRDSWESPYKSFRANSLGTLNVALAAKNFDITEFVYASSATVYGEHLHAPYFEDQDNSRQTSLYAATKYSGESILSAFSFHFPIQVAIFRFGNVLGPYCTHGHLFDFVSRLRKNEEQLDILGSGHQIKTFIHVEDVVSSLSNIEFKSDFQVFNLSRADYSSVRDSVRWLSEVLGKDLQINYGSTFAGWKGDNPRLFLNTDKLLMMGWSPNHSIEKAVKDTVEWLWENQWVYELKN